MREFKNCIWVIILISGIILLISVFTPVTYVFNPSGGMYFWMWDFTYAYNEHFGSIFYFFLLSEPLHIRIPWGLLNILIALIILIGSLILITIGNRVRTGKTNIKDKEKRLVLIGVLMIIAPIIYIITSYIFGNLYYDYIVAPEDYQLWGSGYNPGFAFFGPFIGGALIIATAITSRKMPSKKDVLMDEEKIRSSITTIQPQFRQILNYEKSIWIITLFGGILTLISILTPALSVEISIGTEYFWMWGLFSIILPGFSSSNFFLPLEEPSMYSIPIFLSGLIPAILILISSVMLCITANSIRKDRNDLKSAGNKLIGWGAALILASIIYLIAIDITMGAFIEHLFNDPWNTYFSTPDMWDASKIGFAVIGPFIGGALAITSGIASKTIKPIEEP